MVQHAKKGRKSIGQSTAKVRKYRLNETTDASNSNDVIMENRPLEGEQVQPFESEFEMEEASNVRVYDNNQSVR